MSEKEKAPLRAGPKREAHAATITNEGLKLYGENFYYCSKCDQMSFADPLGHISSALHRLGGIAPFVLDDGGREAAGYQGKTGDCVTRAITIATGKPYQEVYDALWNGLKKYAAAHKDKVARKISRGGGRKGTTPRNGVPDKGKPYIESLGWKWTPTMAIGQGCNVHLRADELPPGRLVVSVSRHLVAVVDGVIHDTDDPSRGGMRCVYGYYSAAEGGE